MSSLVMQYICIYNILFVIFDHFTLFCFYRLISHTHPHTLFVYIIIIIITVIKLAFSIHEKNTISDFSHA